MTELINAVLEVPPWLPPEASWLVLVTLAILAIAAVVDAFTSKVPDNVLLVGFAVLIVGFGIHAGWPLSSTRLSFAIGTAIAFYSMNQIWFKYFHKDAFGMGDAKWSALAIMMFGPIPTVVAWVVGSWLGLMWMAGARTFGKKMAQVHFAPFLFIGLLAGLYFT